MPSPRAGSVQGQTGPARSSRALVWIAAALMALAGAGVLAARTTTITRARPFDFDLNWVAAQRLVDGEPLYDRHDSRAEAIEQFGPLMRLSTHGPYTSYIGAPAVALVHAPFTWLEHDDAIDSFRGLALLGMLGAMAISTLALPRRARGPAGLAAAGALMMSWPLTSTLSIGQANERVMLCVALAVAAAARERWPVVGIVLGCAAILKVTPALIVVYLVVRGRKQVLGYALGAAAGVSVVAAAIGSAARFVGVVPRRAPERIRRELVRLEPVRHRLARPHHQSRHEPRHPVAPRQCA